MRALQRRRRGGDQHQIGGEQSGARDAGDPRRAIDDHMIGVSGDRWQLAMQRFTRQTEDTEQPRHALGGWRHASGAVVYDLAHGLEPAHLKPPLEPVSRPAAIRFVRLEPSRTPLKQEMLDRKTKLH